MALDFIEVSERGGEFEGRLAAEEGWPGAIPLRQSAL